MPFILGLMLFLPAGTFAWIRGWWFIAAYSIALLVSMAVLWRSNPEIFVARARVARDTKSWDYAFLIGFVLAYTAVLPLAAFDDARFRWLPTPGWVVVLGYVLLAGSFGLMIWAQMVNRHFEPGVRIQSDRGHTVIETGPYAVIRHPGYVAGSLMVTGTALSLGSLWALIPAAFATVVLIGRTLMEERTLHADLPGYASYMGRVRFRWLPGIW